MNGANVREVAAREPDEPHEYECRLAVLMSLEEAAQQARQAEKSEEIDWLMPTAEDERAFLELLVGELLRISEEVENA